MPVEAVERVDMSVEALMSIYVSMGVTAPGMMEESDLAKAKAIVAEHQATAAKKGIANSSAGSPETEDSGDTTDADA